MPTRARPLAVVASLAAVLCAVARADAPPIPDFAPPVSTSAGTAPVGVVTGDFDGDGDLDWATADASNSIVKVRRNDGTGLVFSTNGFSLSSAPSDIATGDFDADGKPDLAFATAAGIVVARNLGPDGSQTLQFSMTSPTATTGASYTRLAVADYDGDGDSDLVAVGPFAAPPSFAAGVLSVWLSDGAGGFGTPTDRLYDPDVPDVVAMGDLSGDGKAEIVASSRNTNVLHLYFNPGNGTVDVSESNDGSSTNIITVTSLQIADATRDGRPDIVVGGGDPDSYGGNSVTAYVLPTIVASSQFSVFYTALGYRLNGGPDIAPAADNQAVFADVNGDGFADLVATDRVGGNVYVVVFNEPLRDTLGDVHGMSPVSYTPHAAGATPHRVAVGDFTGDGKADILTANGGTAQAQILVNQGNEGGGGGGDAYPAATSLKVKQPKKLPGNRLQDGKPFTFTCRQPEPGVQVRLQMSSSPEADESWTDVPLNSSFTPKHGSTKWTLVASHIPAGTLWFRTVTVGPDLDAGVNSAAPGSAADAYIGPFEVLGAGAVVLAEVTGYPASDLVRREATHVGDTILYRLSLRNSGTAVAEDVYVDIRPPAGTALLPGDELTTPGFTTLKGGRPATIRWVLPSLDVGASANYIMTVRVEAGAPDFITLKKFGANPKKGRDLKVNDGVEFENRAQVEIEVEARQDAPAPGGTLEYDLTCTNGGSTTLRSAVAWDRLPTGVGFQAAYFLDAGGQITGSPVAAPAGRTNPWFDEANRRVYWYLGDVDAQDDVRLRLVTRVCYDQEPGAGIVNGAFSFRGCSSVGTVCDPLQLDTLDATTGEAYDVETTVGGPPASAIPQLRLGQYAVTEGYATVEDQRFGTVAVGAPGEDVLYLYEVKNTGGAAAEGVRMLGNLPNATTLVAGSLSVGPNLFDLSTWSNYTLSSGGTLDVNLGTIGPSDAAVVLLRVKVSDTVKDRTMLVATGFNLRTQSISGHVFASPTVLNVLVARPYIPYVETHHETQADGPTKGRVAEGAPVTFATTYENRGGQPGTGVTIEQTIPSGCSYAGADFFDGSGSPSSTLPVQATKKKLVVTLGTLSPGQRGTVRFRFTVAKAPAGGYAKSQAKLGGSLAIGAKQGTAIPPSTHTDTFRIDSDTSPKLFLVRVAPQVVETELEFDYTVIVGNAGPTAATGVAVSMDAPAGTRPTLAQHEGFGTDGKVKGRTATWRIGTIPPHSAVVREFHVIVDKDAAKTGNAIIERTLIVGADNCVGWRLDPQASLLLVTGRRFESYTWPAFTLSAEALGAILGTGRPAGMDDAIRAVTSFSTSTVSCGNDILQFVNGAVVAPLGDGRVFAHGPKTDVTIRNGADAATYEVTDTFGDDHAIVAAASDVEVSGLASRPAEDLSSILQAPTVLVDLGLANMVSGGSNTLIARDGRTFLSAAGVPMGTLVEIRTAGIVAAGGGNIVAAGGGNIVAAGGGNIVAAGGGNIVAAGGGNIVAAGGGNIVAAGAGNIVAAGAGNIVAAGGGNIVAAGAGNIVAAGGGNIVAAGGGNIVAAGGGN